ncbi:MAG: hypothetical protein Q7J25_10250 [Vicinamibacterales bacterium]|nr:hypothetical protein [Vicinamibacterales bacterium]
MTLEELRRELRDLHQIILETSNRLLRNAAALERIAKADEDVAALLHTRIHAIGNHVAEIAAGVNVRKEIREASQQIAVHSPDDKPHAALTAFGMFATLPWWLQVLLILAAVVGLLAVGGKLGLTLAKAP